MYLSIEKNVENIFCIYLREELYMKITCLEDKTMNHNEIRMVIHPKNRKVAKLLVNQIENKLGEMVVYDDYRNKYVISILSIYYIEMVDHKMFIYTEKDMYRLFTSLAEIKGKLKGFGFLQINVRTLINSKHIKQYIIKEGCRRHIIMDNDDVLVSNRHFREEFDTMIKNKQFEKKVIRE